MLTVPEAARRVNRDPETIRRWIRSGRLPARKIGTQHFVEESDLLDLAAPEMLPLPAAWRQTFAGEPMPDVVAWLRRSRERR
jgi:excisionase family DNA binding protein